MGRSAPLVLTNEKEVQMSKRLFATAVIASSLVAGLGFSVPAIADAGNGKVVVSQKDDSITIGNNAISRTFDVKGGLKTGKIENKLGGTELTPAEGSEEFYIEGLVNANRVEPENPLTSVKPKALVTTAAAIDYNETEKAEPGAALDGNPDTYWASNEQADGVKPWFELDFHGDKAFRKIKYTPRKNGNGYNATGCITSMDVQIPSADGNGWTTVESCTLKPADQSGIQEIELKSEHVASKLRLTVTGSYHWQELNKNKAANIAEIDVLSADNKSVIDRASENVKGWKAEVSSSSSRPGDNGGASALLDGKPNTFWHSNYNEGTGSTSAPYTVTIDRGEAKTPFQTVAYLPRSEKADANGNWQEFEVYASDSKDGLFDDANKLNTAAGKSTFIANYKDAFVQGTGSKWLYFGLEKTCEKQFVGIKVLSGVNGNATAAEIDFMSEQFTSVDADRPVLKASELKLKGDPVVEDTNVTLNDKAKSGQLVTFNFEPKQFGTSTVTVAQKVVMYDGDHYMRKWLEIESSDEAQRFNYIDGEHLNVKNAKKTWTIPTNKGGVVLMDMAKSILGQPFYAEGMFFGSEFPETDTQIVSGDSDAKIGRSRYWTGKNFADFKRDNQLTKDSGKYVSWQTVCGATHSDGSDMNVIQADFFNYINQISKPSDFRIQYNSWFDNMMRINDENIIESFKAVDKHLNETGVRPLESYVVDDGWNQYRANANDLSTKKIDLERNGSTDEPYGINKSGFWQFNNKFQQGLTPSSDLVQKLGSDFGVWIGPRGGYNYYDSLANIIAKAGNGSVAGSSIDVADQRYVTKFEDMAVKWMKDYGVNYWKWDGFADQAQYNAFKSGDGIAEYDENHQHMVGGPNGYFHSTDLWEKWIDLFDEVWKTAEAEKINEMWISLTCYVNPSPWFLQWSNSVWMQCHADRAEVNNGTLTDKMNTMLTYRDAAYYDFVKNHDFQFPLANLYNHDPIYGKEDTGITADSMDGEQFRNYLYMMGTRGTAFWELYYSDSIFNDEKYLINADFLKWEEENFDMLRNAKWVGGNPSTGVTLANVNGVGDQYAYGFAGFNNAGNEGIISMRNPATTAKKISFKLDSGVGCKSDGSYHVVLDHVYTEGDKAAAEAPKTVKHGQTIEMTLQPGEVQIWHLSKDGDTAAPTLSKLYTENNTTLRVQASEHVFGAKFEVLVNGKKVELADNAVKAYADLKTFDITLPAPYGDNVKIEVKAIAGTDAAGNKLEGSIARTGYTGGIIATVSEPECTTISRKAASVEGSDGFSAEVTVVNPVAGKTILSQGNQWSISINGEGKAVFTMNGVTAVSDVVVPNLASISVARENNGMMKLYVNGEIAGSAFDKKNVDYTVAKDAIKIDKAAAEKISNVVVYDRALGYDEVVGAPLASLIARAKGIQGAVTAESWAAAGMDQLIAAAEAAQGDAQVDAFVKLTDGYNQLLPKQPEVPEPKFENLAQGKNVSAAFVGADGDATNAGSPLNKAVDGSLSTTNGEFAIFGADNQHKPAYMQVDLGSDCDVSGVQLWRFFDGGKKYDTTALVVSSDPEFAEGSYEVLYYSAADKNKDLFGLGVKPTEDLYAESKEGKVLFGSTEDEASQKTVRARYIRLYGNGYEGSNGGDNHVVELKVFGKKVPEPAKKYQPYEYDLLCMMAGRAQAIVDNGKYFTSESLAKVEDALKAARKTIATIDADVEAGSYTLTYGDVYKVRAALESAVACAQERETSDMVPILPSEPVKPSTPLTPLTPAEPIKPGGPGETQGQKPGSSSDKLVQTGDDSLMLIGGTAAAAVALAGAGIALKRRRSNA